MDRLIAYPYWIILIHHIIILQAKVNTKPIKSLVWIDLCSFYFKLKLLVPNHRWYHLALSLNMQMQKIQAILLRETKTWCHGFLIIHFKSPHHHIFWIWISQKLINFACEIGNASIVLKITIFLLWISIIAFISAWMAAMHSHSKDTCADIFLVTVNLVPGQYKLFLLTMFLLLKG